MSLKTCIKCGASKENIETNFRIHNGTGRLRSVCIDCQNKQIASKRKARMSTNETYFWQVRCKAFNKPNKRRSKKSNEAVEKPISVELLRDLYYSTMKCHYCGLKLNKEKIVFDHSTPLSVGGKHEISNIRISCNDCNQLKGTKTESEFNEFIKEYIKRFNRA